MPDTPPPNLDYPNRLAIFRTRQVLLEKGIGFKKVGSMFDFEEVRRWNWETTNFTKESVIVLYCMKNILEFDAGTMILKRIADCEKRASTSIIFPFKSKGWEKGLQLGVEPKAKAEEEPEAMKTEDEQEPILAWA
ncbi:hypothetical protein QYF36_004195 [Acer negundo]|nr:hypothetical protein QYF36_004195 [Acer negundo]